VFPLAVDEITNEANAELADAVMAVQASLIGGAGAGTTLTSLTLSGPLTLSGNLLFSPDNTYNIGTSSASRPRTIWASNTLVSSVGLNVGGVQIYAGNPAPTAGLGVDGDFYFRNGTPGTANQRIYVKSAGAWVGIV